MFPPEFDYRRAASVEEALSLLADDGARVLAGGQSMIPELKTGQAAPGTLVDVGDLDALTGIDVGERETAVGAITTYAELAGADELWEHAPVLAEAATELGDRQVRNRGTIGGNLAQADPDGDLPAAVVAADATIVVRGRDGEREIPAGDFFVGDGETVLDDELVTTVRVPHADGGVYVKKEHPATGYAMVGVAAVVEVDGGDTVSTVGVAANGVQPHAVRLPSVEEALSGGPVTDEAIEAAAEQAPDDLDSEAIPSDPYASGEFRANLLSTYAERALARAVERARGTGDSTATDGGGGR